MNCSGHRRLWVMLLLIAMAFPIHAQVVNLANYDHRLLHYGIQVGMASSKFDIDYTREDSIRGSLQNTVSMYSPGFHIAVIGDLRLGRSFSLRMLPGVSILSRHVDYSWSDGYIVEHPLVDDRRHVESVYGELPIEIKYKAMRWKNFRPYVTLGGSYGFDFASLRKNKNNNDESIIRLEANDLRYTAGVGIDFFLKYVKFAVEFKMSFGGLDLSVKDTDIYSQAIEGMRSRTYMLSFTFEG